MKKIALILMLVLLVPVISAVQSEDVVIRRIRLGDYGVVSTREMRSFVYVRNNAEERIDNGHVTVRFMDDGFYDSSSHFDIRSNSGAGRSLVSDVYGVSPGEHLVKVTYRAGNIRRVKYRRVFIE
ncbi:MAG: hypothetical protein MAG795_00571 [Candidatus Woesearchaeota archaeon]|nr:hypothetical protein [Candidatus Woesearchaeota archaeon]